MLPPFAPLSVPALLVASVLWMSPDHGGSSAHATSVADLERAIAERLVRDERLAADSLASLLLLRAREEAGSGSLAEADVLDLMVEIRIRGRRTREPATDSLANRALAIRERRQGREHPALSTSLAGLGWVRVAQGRYADAGDLLGRALDLSRRGKSPDSLAIARCSRAMGSLRRANGQYLEAREDFEQSLHIYESRRPPARREMIMTLDDMSELARRTGDREGLRRNSERQISLETEIVGPDHPNVAQLMVERAAHLIREEDFAGARPLTVRAISIFEAHEGPDAKTLVQPLIFLGEIEQRIGPPGAAMQAFERALRIAEAHFGPQSVRVAMILRSVADARVLTRNLAGADSALTRALAIFETRFGKNDLHVGVVLQVLSQVRWLRGERESARTLLDRALEVREKIVGPEHPDVARILAIRGAMEAQSGDTVAAFATALKAEAVGRRHLGLTISTLSEREALGYASTRSSALDLVLGLALLRGDSASVRGAWDAVLSARAVVADELTRRNRVPDSGHEAERKAFEAASERLARLIVQGPGFSPSSYRARVDSALGQREAAERALARVTHADPRRRGEHPGAREIGAALPRGTALVAYVTYAPGALDVQRPLTYRDSLPRSFAAFVVRDRGLTLRAIPLGDEREIEDLARAWRREVGTEKPDVPAAEKRCRQAGEALRRRVWDRTAESLRGVDRVFVVPDGVLNLVNLSALPVGRSEFVIERAPAIHLLESERDVLQPAEAAGHGILLLGGCSFNSVSVATEDVLTRRPSSSPCADFRSLSFHELPGSAKEVRDIATLCRERTARANGTADVIGLTESEASEEAFKRHSRGKRVVHLATHGFFLDDRCGSTSGRRGVGGLGSESDVPSTASDDSPPLAGLVLSGANQRMDPKRGQEDGILAAEEIAALNLGGTEWAVLSGCVTGLGLPIRGEGLTGLRRAFRTAGVRTVIVSLWATEDEPARQWMLGLYRARLTGDDTAQSVRKASLDALAALRSRGASTHPARWGAFVAFGDWR